MWPGFPSRVHGFRDRAHPRRLTIFDNPQSTQATAISARPHCKGIDADLNKEIGIGYVSAERGAPLYL